MLTNEKKQILLNHIIDISTSVKFHEYKVREPHAVKAAFLIVLLRLLNLNAKLS